MHADINAEIFVMHLFHGLTVMKTLKIDNGKVIKSNAVIRIGSLHGSLMTLEEQDFFIDFLFGHLKGRFFDLKTFELGQIEHRLDIDQSHINKGAILGKLVLGDFGMHYRFNTFLLHRVKVGILHQFFAYLSLNLTFKILFQDALGDFAATKTLEGDVLVDFGVRLVQGLPHGILRKSDGQFSCQIRKVFDGDFHGR